MRKWIDFDVSWSLMVFGFSIEYTAWHYTKVYKNTLLVDCLTKQILSTSALQEICEKVILSEKKKMQKEKQRQRRVSQFKSRHFKRSGDWSQRLMKGHFGTRMKTWQENESVDYPALISKTPLARCLIIPISLFPHLTLRHQPNNPGRSSKTWIKLKGLNIVFFLHYSFFAYPECILLQLLLITLINDNVTVC